MPRFAYPNAVSINGEDDWQMFVVTWANGTQYVRYVRPDKCRAFRAYLNALGKAGAVKKYVSPRDNSYRLAVA